MSLIQDILSIQGLYRKKETRHDFCCLSYTLVYRSQTNSVPFPLADHYHTHCDLYNNLAATGISSSVTVTITTAPQPQNSKTQPSLTYHCLGRHYLLFTTNLGVIFSLSLSHCSYLVTYDSIEFAWSINL